MKKIIMLILAICVVLTGCGKKEEVSKLNTKKDKEYVVLLDINPSIKLTYNEKKIVKKIEALNEDAKKITKDIKNNSKLDEVLDSIVDNLIKEKYLESDEMILITSNEDEVSNEVGNTINKSLEKKEHKSSVEKQVIKDDLKKKAYENDISLGKTRYIEKIIENDETLELKDLKDKPIKELVKIKKEKQKTTNKVEEEKTTTTTKEHNNTKTTKEKTTKVKTTKLTTTKANKEVVKDYTNMCSSVKPKISKEDALKIAIEEYESNSSRKYNGTNNIMTLNYLKTCVYYIELNPGAPLQMYFYVDVTDGTKWSWGGLNDVNPNNGKVEFEEPKIDIVYNNGVEKFNFFINVKYHANPYEYTLKITRNGELIFAQAASYNMSSIDYLPGNYVAVYTAKDRYGNIATGRKEWTK